MRKQQAGFTLVEIAIVLVIIGLLLGGIIQGQQLINSARVKNLAETNSGVQAAYFGFIDRYRQVPGDMTVDVANAAIGVPITGGGNGNGRLDNPPATLWAENNAAWEHMSKAGFIQGSYLGTSAEEPSFNNNIAPVNAFNSPMLLGVTDDYLDTNVAGAVNRLHLVIGRGVPVGIQRELDVKIDDGVPNTGTLRATVNGTANDFTGTNNWGGSDVGVDCANVTVTPSQWNVAGNSSDCNSVFLF